MYNKTNYSIENYNFISFINVTSRDSLLFFKINWISAISMDNSTNALQTYCISNTII